LRTPPAASLEEITGLLGNLLLPGAEIIASHRRRAAGRDSRIAAYDYACTMTFDEVMKLTELSIQSLSRSIDELKR